MVASGGAARAGGMDAPRVVGRRLGERLPGRVGAVVGGLQLQIAVVLRHGPGVAALPGGVGGGGPVSPLLVQQEALQGHRAALGQEEGGARQVVAGHEHLPGALQVEQDAGADGVEDVAVVLQESVLEHAVVAQTHGLRGWERKSARLQHVTSVDAVVRLCQNSSEHLWTRSFLPCALPYWNRGWLEANPRGRNPTFKPEIEPRRQFGNCDLRFKPGNESSTHPDHT